MMQCNISYGTLDLRAPMRPNCHAGNAWILNES
jgi:hypothetical protein